MQSKKVYTVLEAKTALEHFCAYQERTHREVAQKLQKMGMITEVKEQIVIHLIQENYLNEERFARSFTRGKFNQNNWGRIKITQALYLKGVSKVNIELGMQEIDAKAYNEKVKKLAQKKWESLKGNPFTKKQKVYSYLLQKGYESNLIGEVLAEY